MYIDEPLVSFIWQHCYFNTTNIKTTTHDEILIRCPGQLNPHAGPDFLDSKIKIGDIEWVGSVEIHVRSSHWNTHDHSSNPDYNKVILHVVWKHDADVRRYDGTPIPTLEIQNLVSDDVLDKYTSLMYSRAHFPCHPHLLNAKYISILSMIDKSMISRLKRKADNISGILDDTMNNWEETAYRVLVKNFGFKVNQDNMYLLARLLPLAIISRHRENVFQIEALLFGMAGFLTKACDAYSSDLKSEYEYLYHKYSLNAGFLQRYQWKFLRLRPQNFPTVRLAQLAVLLCRMDKIFSNIVEFRSIKKIVEILKTRQTAYWIEHYDFGKKYNKRLSGLGISSIRNILTNTFVPLLSAYAKHMNNDQYIARAVKILEAIPPENNQIIRTWIQKGIKPFNSFESQGLIELSNSYCYKKKCLNCNIGTDILMN